MVVGSNSSGRVQKVFIGMKVVRGPDWLDSCTDDVTTTGGVTTAVRGPGVITVTLTPPLRLARLPSGPF